MKKYFRVEKEDFLTEDNAVSTTCSDIYAKWLNEGVHVVNSFKVDEEGITLNVEKIELRNEEDSVCDEVDNDYLLREANRVIEQVKREIRMIVRLAGDTLTTDIEEYLMINAEKLAKMNSRIEKAL